MTAYRLFPSTNGPSTTAASGYSGNFISGVVFTVSSGCWFTGYWWWVCAGGNQLTTPVKCALWSATSSGSGTVVAGSVVTSGTLTAGQWNYIPLSAPVQLSQGLDTGNTAHGSAYVAAVGCNGPFPGTQSQFNSGDTYSAGITQGPLFAYSGKTGSAAAPWTLPQSCFTTGGSDPSAHMPNGQDSGGDGGTNFWVDVQVSTAVPAGYAGSYRLWPGKADSNLETSLDSAVTYVVATEVHLSQACTLSSCWYYSCPGAASLATWCGVYSIGGTGSGTLKASVSSPSWSGAAGSGWVSAAFAGGTVLPAGSYKVAVYNSGGASGDWSPKDADSGYWTTGAASSGITWGPLSAPALSAASQAYVFDGSGGSDTPPYSDGSGDVTAGTSTFAMTGPQYPYLTTGSSPVQNYWTDMEVVPLASGARPLMAGYL